MRRLWMWLQHSGAAIERRRAVAIKLGELDERTLRDIGLESWRSALGAEVALRRHQDRGWRAAQLGLW